MIKNMQRIQVEDKESEAGKSIAEAKMKEAVALLQGSDGYIILGRQPDGRIEVRMCVEPKHYEKLFDCTIVLAERIVECQIQETL